MDDNVDWNLLARYLFNEASEEEKARVEAEVEADPDREDLLRQLRKIKEKTGQPLSAEWDSDVLWERFQEHVRSEKKAPEGEDRSARQSEATRSSAEQRRASAAGPDADRGASNRDRRKRSSRSTARHVLRTLAPVAVVAIVVFALVQLQEGRPFFGFLERDARVLTTQKGEQNRVQLADETFVYLNADSKLTLHSGFGQGAREVSLRGEAYFDVARETSRPFIVHAGGTTTEVLGTKFNVNTYDEDVQVVVAEGRLALHPEGLRGRRSNPEERSEQMASEKGAILEAGQMGRFSQEDGIIVDTTGVALTRHLAWKEGWLVFKNASFGEVERRLERWYGLEISASDSLKTDGHLNAKFSDRWSSREVLNTIATVFELGYKQEDRVVRFFSAEDSS